MGDLLILDPSKRRSRPTARCVTPADVARIGMSNRLAALEEERHGLRDRLEQALEGSEYRSALLCRLATMNEDVEFLRELLDRDNVVELRRARG